MGNMFASLGWMQADACAVVALASKCIEVTFAKHVAKRAERCCFQQCVHQTALATPVQPLVTSVVIGGCYVSCLRFANTTFRGIVAGWAMHVAFKLAIC